MKYWILHRNFTFKVIINLLLLLLLPFYNITAGKPSRYAIMKFNIIKLLLFNRLTTLLQGLAKSCRNDKLLITHKSIINLKLVIVIIHHYLVQVFYMRRVEVSVTQRYALFELIMRLVIPIAVTLIVCLIAKCRAPP